MKRLSLLAIILLGSMLAQAQVITYETAKVSQWDTELNGYTELELRNIYIVVDLYKNTITSNPNNPQVYRILSIEETIEQETGKMYIFNALSPSGVSMSIAFVVPDDTESNYIKIIYWYAKDAIVVFYGDLVNYYENED